MKSFKIISDSSCDLPQQAILENEIDLVPYSVSFDKAKYYKENVDLSVDEFHHILKTSKAFPKTSLPPIQDYVDVFKNCLDNGENDIICVCLTKKFSGSYQSAITAANILKEDGYDHNIIVLDSMTATAAQGLAVREIARMREDGKSINEAAEIFSKIRTLSNIFFTVDSLDYLQKGGRIGLVTALAGGILNIKPIINLTNGELVPHSKVRGRKKSIQTVIDLTKNEIAGKKEKFTFATIEHDEALEEQSLKDTLIQQYGYEIPLPPFKVGVTIGAHTGPTPVGIAYFPKYEKCFD